jgi:hypothetical protein
MLGNPAPYLSLEERAQYLIDRGYAVDGVVTDGTREFLARTNFHYFLGYARNFRKLVAEGAVDGDTSLDRVVRLIRLDHRFSASLFQGIGELEWLLRASLVEAHCSMHPAASCFLDPGHFLAAHIDGRPTHEVVREQILRTREPYILEQFEKVINGPATPAAISRLSEKEKDEVIRELPIWAVVDGWTMGVLARVIMGTVSPAGSAAVMWKTVAQHFSVSNSIVDGQLTGLVVLRNQVAHHVRLWMRPTTSSAKLPKLFEKRGRDCDAKSMYVAVLALAAFLRRSGSDGPFLAEVDGLLAEDSLFERGIKRPVGQS